MSESELRLTSCSYRSPHLYLDRITHSVFTSSSAWKRSRQVTAKPSLVHRSQVGFGFVFTVSDSDSQFRIRISNSKLENLKEILLCFLHYFEGQNINLKGI